VSELTEPQRAWIAALRSGKYAQTREVLCRLDEKGEPVGYCCLGVACEVAREHGITSPSASRPRATTRARSRCARSILSRVAAAPVVAWLGLREDIGTFDNDGRTDRSPILNDKRQVVRGDRGPDRVAAAGPVRGGVVVSDIPPFTVYALTDRERLVVARCPRSPRR
jgi:hypothetical protein